MGAIFGLTVSTAYILLSCLIAWWARRLVERLCPKPTLWRSLLLEAVATWELCATCFELIIVADNYGVWTYGLYLLLLTIWWSEEWGEAAGCPYVHIESVLEEQASVMKGVAKSLAELAGGALTYRYAMFLWSLEVSLNHRGRAYEACTADLQVPALIGMVIEGVCTCLCRVVSRGLSDAGFKYSTVLDAIFGTSLVIAAFNYSGGYFNPALATGLKYGCSGHSTLEFLLVYWLGACLGSVASVYAYRSQPVQGAIRRLRGKAD